MLTYISEKKGKHKISAGLGVKWDWCRIMNAKGKIRGWLVAQINE